MKIKYFAEISTPKRGTPQSAGFDLVCCMKGAPLQGFNSRNEPISVEIHGGGKHTNYVLIPPRSRLLMPTGFYTDASEAIEFAWFAVAIRSGTAWNKGLQLGNGIAVIDRDVRKQWHLIVYNPMDVEVRIDNFERLAQFVPLPSLDIQMEAVLSLEEITISETDRKGGFGSTGK